MIYRRKLGDESYTVALNFSFRDVKLPKKAADFLGGAVIVSTSGRQGMDGRMLPWEGVLLS